MQPLPLLGTVLLLLAAIAPAQSQVGIKGRVTDKTEHAPIRNVFVLVHGGRGTDIHVRTDGTGVFWVQLPPGVYDLFFSAEGFLPSCRKVEIPSDGMTSLDTVLEANTLGMEED
jgi:Carboxypeptidase regulatory-like domain